MCSFCLLGMNLLSSRRKIRRIFLLKEMSLHPVFSVSRSLVLYVVFCRSLFVLFLLAIVLSVLLRFMDSDYPFGIFKLFLHLAVNY